MTEDETGPITKVVENAILPTEIYGLRYDGPKEGGPVAQALAVEREYENLGFRFRGRDEDPLFRKVKDPTGWTRRQSGFPYWATIHDERDFARVVIFYKPEDQRATATLGAVGSKLVTEALYRLRPAVPWSEMMDEEVADALRALAGFRLDLGRLSGSDGEDRRRVLESIEATIPKTWKGNYAR